MSESSVIEPHHLGLAEPPPLPQAAAGKEMEITTLKEARKKFEMELIEMAVSKHRGNIKNAAKDLGISRPTLYDLITKYGLNVKYTIE